MIEEIYKVFEKSRVISTDSRAITPNSLFFALKGDNFDGNDYVLSALESGCVAAVASDKKYVGVDNVFVVEDTLKALQQLANFHRRKLRIPILAITGTNGKTTTKELTSAVLAKKFRISYTQGNKNNHIGVPLTILSMNRTVDMGVVEMGANHPGEIKTLCEIAEPNYGIITNVGKAHLEGFGSIEGVMRTKGELYDYLNEHDGTIFINDDNELLKQVLSGHDKLKVVRYGKNEACFCSGVYSEYAYQTAVNWKSQNATGYVKSNLIGMYNFENILAAITIGNHFEIHPTAIDSAISDYMPKNNRSQMTKTSRNTLILDLYNANPTSMKAAIDSYNTIKDSHKSLILGDMLELGAESDTEHREVLDYVRKSGYEMAYFIGKNFIRFAQEYPEFMFFASVEDTNKYFIANPEKSKIFLIKGSRGVRLEKVVDFL
ncbi:MAG: UDP-N-acetylmuramoyl-tripeptide--D-alanyl-D-alanine ligase [Bacteroidales bacterium]|nr:UDP-N-acetylmuramoyl-tripeptide--D-alanyl-D-alanine ligase [Bacteroidales bacterium]